MNKIIVYGPYLRKDGRKHLVLYDKVNKTRKTVSYSKYLLEQKIGRSLNGDETCDHIDDNFKNDSIDNLQVLSRTDNAYKALIGKPRAKSIILVCKNCSNSFSRLSTIEQRRVNRGLDGPFCSKYCVGKIHH